VITRAAAVRVNRPTLAIRACSSIKYRSVIPAMYAYRAMQSLGLNSFRRRLTQFVRIGQVSWKPAAAFRMRADSLRKRADYNNVLVQEFSQIAIRLTNHRL